MLQNSVRIEGGRRRALRGSKADAPALLHRRLRPSLYLAVVLGLAVLGPVGAQDHPLPDPQARIPDNPVLVPQVITRAGQRLLLDETDVRVRYDRTSHRLVSSHGDWWIINYPFERIEGLEGQNVDQIAERLFGRRLEDVRNWYLRTRGPAVDEPARSPGPAPIKPTAQPTLIVDAAHPQADDANDGTAQRPLRTIQAAIDRAVAGAVIHVHPGIYRESITVGRRLHSDGRVAGTHGEPGTAERPIRIEGIRDEQGRMPVISGNDRFPTGAWSHEAAWPRVYRADLFTQRLGTVSADGKALTEANIPHALQPGEFHLNRASREFLNLRIDPRISPRSGNVHDGIVWQQVTADEEGYLDLRAHFGDEAASAVIWASTWVWVEPGDRQTWNPAFPEPIQRRVNVDGRFRAARMPGASLSGQVNKYRVWVNGELVPAINSGGFRTPRASWMYGSSDQWRGFPLQEGWNHLVFQFDTTTRAAQGRHDEELKFRFSPGNLLGSAEAPRDSSATPDGELDEHVTRYLIWGRVPAGEPDLGVYVRLPEDADPNDVEMDLAARGSELVTIRDPFTHFRGFEVRHGSQFQQRGQVSIEGEGSSIEGCLILDSEWIGLRVHLADEDRDVRDEPIVLRNNWIINAGDTGIGGGGHHARYLTRQTQDYPYPGNLPVIIEHNTIVDYGRRGVFGAMDGGMKLFNLKHAVIRYNTIRGGFSNFGGIWLDWGHYNNRLEGNLSLDGIASGISIEASPGPHLVANNLVIGLRPGGQWFRAAILAWDSRNVWTIHNTIDGKWDQTIGWQGYVGAEGIRKNRPGRRTVSWDVVPYENQRYYNNIILGKVRAMNVRADDGHYAEANYTDRGSGATPLDPPAEFVQSLREDYRLRPGHRAEQLGVANEYTALVRHDFHGLLRFEEDGRSVGAFRPYRPIAEGVQTEIEVEFVDGAMERRSQ